VLKTGFTIQGGCANLDAAIAAAGLEVLQPGLVVFDVERSKDGLLRALRHVERLLKESERK
jgi:uncharacterized protein YbjT (DUF2867 family)